MMISRSDSTSTRLDEMRFQVKAFHSKHPEVWDLFVRFTKEILRRGFKHYSVNAIFERIRWEVDTVGRNDQYEFKLNNNYRAFYARRFMRMYPQHDGFFRTRRQTSQEDYPTQMSPLTPRDYQ